MYNMDTIERHDSFVRSTRIYPDNCPNEVSRLMYTALGLSGEAGEVANIVKKIYRDNQEVTDKNLYDLTEELGDVLWYLLAMLQELNISVDEITELNRSKLTLRRSNKNDKKPET